MKNDENFDRDRNITGFTNDINIPTINNNERKSTYAAIDKSEPNLYKRLLEDSYIRIESYKRIIDSKDEALQGMKKSLDDIKRKNNVFHAEIAELKRNYTL